MSVSGRGWLLSQKPILQTGSGRGPVVQTAAWAVRSDPMHHRSQAGGGSSSATTSSRCRASQSLGASTSPSVKWGE